MFTSLSLSLSLQLINDFTSSGFKCEQYTGNISNTRHVHTRGDCDGGERLDGRLLHDRCNNTTLSVVGQGR